jgi:hypothetical protein
VQTLNQSTVGWDSYSSCMSSLIMSPFLSLMTANHSFSCTDAVIRLTHNKTHYYSAYMRSLCCSTKLRKAFLTAASDGTWWPPSWIVRAGSAKSNARAFDFSWTMISSVVPNTWSDDHCLKWADRCNSQNRWVKGYSRVWMNVCLFVYCFLLQWLRSWQALRVTLGSKTMSGIQSASQRKL